MEGYFSDRSSSLSFVSTMAFTRQLYKQQNSNSTKANCRYTHESVHNRAETDRSVLERKVFQDRIETDRQGYEARASMKRYNRELAYVEQDRAMEAAIIRAQMEKNLAGQRREQNERLAMELERSKLNQIRDTKMRQQIRETSNELRELESKLRSEYIQKVRTVQVAEKQASKLATYLEDVDIVQCMRDEARRAEEIDRQRELARQQASIRYKHELEQQLREQEIIKQKAYEEFLRDKLMIDEIVRKIYDEDQREMERRLERRRARREDILAFKRKCEEWKARELQRVDEENRRVKEFIKLQQQRHAIVRAEKRSQEQAFDRMHRHLSEQILRDQREREEEELIRQELHFEEREQAARQREREEIEARIRKRLQLQRQREEQMRLTYWKNLASQQEETRARQELLAKFAEDDRIDQMNEQKRRMKQNEHKRAVDLLLEQRREKMVRDKQNEMDERLEEERMERIRKEIIEEERVKLLEEHAHRLLGYFPKDVIQDEKNFGYLSPDLKNQFQRRPNGWIHQSMS